MFRNTKPKSCYLRDTDGTESVTSRHKATRSRIDAESSLSRKPSNTSTITERDFDSRRASSVTSKNPYPNEDYDLKESPSKKGPSPLFLSPSALKYRRDSLVSRVSDAEEALPENCDSNSENAGEFIMDKDTTVLTLDDIDCKVKEDRRTWKNNTGTVCCFPDSKSSTKRQDNSKEMAKNGEGEKKTNDKQSKKGSSKKLKIGPLPHWCIYVGWSLCITSSVTSALFTLFYSMMWGTAKSNEWLVTMLFSFSLDVLVSQPIKVLLISVLFALIIKKPHDDDEDLAGTTAEKGADEEWMHKDVFDNNVINEDIREEELRLHQPPDPAELEEMRQSKLKEKKLMNYLQKLLFYTVMLIVVTIIGYGQRNTQSYPFRQSLERSLIQPLNRSELSTGKFNQVNNVNKFWDYVRQTLLPGLFEHAWYNGAPARRSGFTADRQSSRVGVARLRQLRVNNGSCTVPEPMDKVLAECNIDYTIWKEKDAIYSSRWTNPLEKEDYQLLGHLKGQSRVMGRLSPWHHLTSSEANHSLPVIGTISTYSGSGYIAELGHNIQYARAYVDYLMQSHWIDKYTRGVFLETTLYNSNVNLFAVFDVLIEFTTAGLAVSNTNFILIDVYPENDPGYTLNSTCELLFVFLLLYCIYLSARTCYRQRCRYFKRVRNWVDIVFLANGIACVVLYVIRYQFIKQVGKLLKEDRTTFLDFYDCAVAVDTMVYLVAFGSYLTVLKLLDSMSFARSMQLLNGTLRNAAQQLHYFLLILFILLMAYTTLMFPILCPYIKEYSTPPRTLQALFSMMLGSFNYNDFVLQSDFQALGRLFFIAFNVTIIFVFMNLFLSIINNVYAEIEDDEEFKRNQFDFFNMARERILTATGLRKPPKRMSPVKEEPDIKELHWNRSMQYVLGTQVVRLHNKLNYIFMYNKMEDLEDFKLIATAKGVCFDKIENNNGIDNKGYDSEGESKEEEVEQLEKDNGPTNVLLSLIAKKEKQLEGILSEDERTRTRKVLKCLEELLEQTKQRSSNNAESGL